MDAHPGFLIKFTYLFKIVIPQAPRGATSTLSGHAATLLATTGRAEVGSVRTALLRGLGSRWGWFSLESFHLLVKLGGKLLVLFGELAHAILRNPVVPTVEKKMLLAVFLVFLVCPLRGR